MKMDHKERVSSEYMNETEKSPMAGFGKSCPDLPHLLQEFVSGLFNDAFSMA
jgi:hypothetical protein